jgi:hypothetical protein
MLNGRY